MGRRPIPHSPKRVSRQPWIVALSPNHSGPRAQAADGVVVHSTRGGAAYGVEFDATLRWFSNPASQVSAHVVIGRDGRRAQCVPDEWIAWHAKAWNATHLGVELEQPTADDDYTDAQYYLLAEWILGMRQRYGFGLDREHSLVGHEEIDPANKSDPGSLFSWQKLQGLLLSLQQKGLSHYVLLALALDMV